MDPLAGKYTYFQRLLHRFKARRDIPFRRKFFVGYDLSGNTYWEFTIDGNMHRLRRKLEPYEPKLFKADYFNDVPPQWIMWLRRTRKDPPSLEELMGDQARQHRIKVLAQQADDRWHNEKLRLQQEQQSKLQMELDRAKHEAEEFEKQREAAKKAVQSQPDLTAQDPWAEADKTESIAPASIRPRGKADPWAEAEASKDKDPITAASIKPR